MWSTEPKERKEGRTPKPRLIKSSDGGSATPPRSTVMLNAIDLKSNSPMKTGVSGGGGGLSAAAAAGSSFRSSSSVSSKKDSAKLVIALINGLLFFGVGQRSRRHRTANQHSGRSSIQRAGRGVRSSTGSRHRLPIGSRSAPG